jgi:hypothetical protein
MFISDREIMETAIALVEADPWRPITPGLVYKERGASGMNAAAVCRSWWT